MGEVDVYCVQTERREGGGGGEQASGAYVGRGGLV